MPTADYRAAATLSAVVARTWPAIGGRVEQQSKASSCNVDSIARKSKSSALSRKSTTEYCDDCGTLWVGTGGDLRGEISLRQCPASTEA
jgi:hypothetical protein